MLKHKFRAQPTQVENHKFSSKLEARFYQELCRQQEKGLVVGFLLQPAFHFQCGSKYIADFLIFYADGTAEFIDTKGVETEVFKLKKRMLEAEFPWAPVRIIKKA